MAVRSSGSRYGDLRLRRAGPGGLRRTARGLRNDAGDHPDHDRVAWACIAAHLTFLTINRITVAPAGFDTGVVTELPPGGEMPLGVEVGTRASPAAAR